MIKGGLRLLEPPEKPDREPKYDLSNRDKADPKTKSTEAAKARNEVQPGHLWGSFKLWNDGDLIEDIFSIYGQWSSSIINNILGVM